MTEYIISRADLSAIQRTKIDLYGGVELIRCKDCRYAKCIEQNDDWWECSHDKRVMHGDGFCSWAERKEE